MKNGQSNHMDCIYLLIIWVNMGEYDPQLINANHIGEYVYNSVYIYIYRFLSHSNMLIDA